jgi:hypothetical protein
MKINITDTLFAALKTGGEKDEGLTMFSFKMRLSGQRKLRMHLGERQLDTSYACFSGELLFAWEKKNPTLLHLLTSCCQ